jgi:hypothetical protein
MSAKPLAEAYEKLKQLRRQGEPDAETPREMQRVAEAFVSVLEKFGMPETIQSANLVRTLEIKTIADRVFGDEEKADAWLRRPNASLSGQTPADLLKDELGAAVVREMLERIDHGIFA